jgi:DNA topoisomerase-1
VLKGKHVERVVFNAVTKQAIADAIASPRQIDVALVDAYLARRALDYLVGFTLSPVLWRKLPGARSAGRVQSVALRLVCDRERDIEAFKPQEYWSIIATLGTGRNERFAARVVGADGKKLGRLDIGDEQTARSIETSLKGATYSVASVEAKGQKRNPYPPFTTSTLQQEASRKLGFAAARTMQVAQRLYEGVEFGGDTVGLITYMRTDGVDLAPEAIAAIRSAIGRDYGDRYVPSSPRVYKTKAKNAQEAHEAIRPTDINRRPEDVARSLEPDMARLYELIWKRAMACQMASADIERTTAEIVARRGGKEVQLRATGQVIKFDGFLTLYQEGRDDEEDEDSARLPGMTSGEGLTEHGISTEQHFTEPPARYTEATLIKKMEELGIGRPSTYTSTLSVLRDRGYVKLDKKRLVPEDKGRLVTAFLESFFGRYVEYDFTAGLEEKLDKISAGELSWRDVLREFWKDFSGQVEEIKDLRVSEVLDALNELLGPHIFPDKGDGTDPRTCPSCGTGRLSLKVGKYGAFIGCSNYPECRFTRQLAVPDGDEAGKEGGDGKRVLGLDPESGLDVSVRTGRFGPYLQLGEANGEEKPKRANIPKGYDPATIELDAALALLALPRELGAHPETGKPISAGIGRYGPFVLHDGTYANLDSVEEVFTVGLNRAVSLIAEKKESGGRPRGASQVLKSLGDHPEGGAVTVRTGRYGPYVNHGKINATLPRGVDPDEVTLAQAAELIARKAEAGPAKKRPARKNATRPKSPSKRKSKAKDDEQSTERSDQEPETTAG